MSSCVTVHCPKPTIIKVAESVVRNPSLNNMELKFSNALLFMKKLFTLCYVFSYFRKVLFGVACLTLKSEMKPVGTCLVGAPRILNVRA